MYLKKKLKHTHKYILTLYIYDCNKYFFEEQGFFVNQLQTFFLILSYTNVLAFYKCLYVRQTFK